jgi:hypothetical protein
MSDGPRRHHYLFAHSDLPGAAFRFGADLMTAGRDGRLTLATAWDRVGEALPPDQRLPATGLAVSHHAVTGHEVLLVEFPPAEHPAEAHFAAVTLSGAGGVRYFTLEDGRSVMDGSRYTVLAEWTEDRKHINYGSGPAAAPEAFLAALPRLLT